jgi:hypothetical protein
LPASMRTQPLSRKTIAPNRLSTHTARPHLPLQPRVKNVSEPKSCACYCLLWALFFG